MRGWVSTSSEEMEGAPQVAGMSPLIVSHAQPVPTGEQRPVRVLAILTW